MECERSVGLGGLPPKLITTTRDCNVLVMHDMALFCSAYPTGMIRLKLLVAQLVERLTVVAIPCYQVVPGSIPGEEISPFYFLIFCSFYM